MRKIITMIFTGILIYSIIKFKNGGTDPVFLNKDKTEYIEGETQPQYVKEAVAAELEGNVIEKSISTILINILKTEKGRLLFEKMLRPVNSPMTDADYSVKTNDTTILNSGFRIKTTKEGTSSQKAICGHMVNVTYSVINMNNKVIDSGTKNIRLGQGSIFKGIDNIIVGMKLNEGRSAIIPTHLAYENPNYHGKKPASPTKDYKVHVTLHSINSDIFIDDDVKIFDEDFAFKTPILCGDKVDFHAKIKDFMGNTIYDSKHAGSMLSFNLGDINYPIIFSHGLFNKHDNGERFVFTKGKYLLNFSKDHHENAIVIKENINPENFYIVELTNVKPENNLIGNADAFKHQ